jgi:uncharacterized damage-inducible protein DinB
MDEQTVEQVIDTWNMHNRIHIYLLDAIAPEALADVSLSKGRSVGEQFEHVHNVRLMWLKSAAPDLLKGTDKPEKIEQEQSNDKPLLLHALDLSGLAIAELLRRGIETGRIKGFKPHPLAFLGYLISHESYHRAEIGIILTQAGHPLDKKVSYGLWEWGVR